MKFAIICKKKTKVNITARCNGEDLVIMGSVILNEAISKLTDEKKVNREEITGIIKELLDEKVFINK
ncbi:hypothetical protein [Clostridium celatum]|uniref:hypothetical protein n=1 Tax=Clostridium celatum TaxID=36834 RepID=UPI0018996DD4|nr:hypothetical protein [Clostridium celatum]